MIKYLPKQNNFVYNKLHNISLKVSNIVKQCYRHGVK